MLEGVNVALGVIGNIAAVKVVELAHELRRRGVPARVVMTDAVTGIIHLWAVEFATGDDAVTEITGRVEYVDLCGHDGWADVSLVAPATVSTVGKITAVIDDSPVTIIATTALRADVSVVVAPAMYEPMYDHPGVLDATEWVWSWGVEFIDPHIKEGKAKIATEGAIVTGVVKATTDQTLAGTSVVVTAGATTESTDPVRVLSNRASGCTGRVVAHVLAVRGTDVILAHDGDDAHHADVLVAESAVEMLDVVEAAVDAGADTLVSAAAISDFTVEVTDQKVCSGEACMLDLEPTPRLIDTVRESHPDLPIVGFKAEMIGDDEATAGEVRRIMDYVGLAFAVVNDAPAMGDSETRAFVVRADETSGYVGSRDGLGARVATELATELEK